MVGIGGQPGLGFTFFLLPVLRASHSVVLILPFVLENGSGSGR